MQRLWLQLRIAVRLEGRALEAEQLFWGEEEVGDPGRRIDHLENQQYPPRITLYLRFFSLLAELGAQAGRVVLGVVCGGLLLLLEIWEVELEIEIEIGMEARMA